MKLQHITIALSLLSQSFLCLSMKKAIITTPTPIYSYWFPEKKFIDFPKAENDMVNTSFQLKFGYDIPEIVIKETIGDKSVYKAVPKSYLNQNNSGILLEIQDTFNPQLRKKISLPEKIVQSTKKIDTLPTTEELFKKKLMAEELILQKTLENKKDKEELLSLQKENAFITKKIESTQQSTAAIKKEIANVKTQITQQKKHVAPPQKKSTTEKLKNPNRPQHNPNKNILQQKLNALRRLLKENNVRTQEQLKNKFANECYENQTAIKYGRINYYCTWQYVYREYGHIANRLEFDTDNCPSSESSSEEEEIEEIELSSSESSESSTEEESSSECECSSDEDSYPH